MNWELRIYMFRSYSVVLSDEVDGSGADVSIRFDRKGAYQAGARGKTRQGFSELATPRRVDVHLGVSWNDTSQDARL